MHQYFLKLHKSFKYVVATEIQNDHFEKKDMSYDISLIFFNVLTYDLERLHKY